MVFNCIFKLFSCCSISGPSAGKMKKGSSVKQTSSTASMDCGAKSVIEGCACKDNTIPCTCKDSTIVCQGGDQSNLCQCNKNLGEQLCRNLLKDEPTDTGLENMNLFRTAISDTGQSKGSSSEHAQTPHRDKGSRLEQGGERCNDKKTSAACSLTSSFDLSAIADGENAMFPDMIDKQKDSDDQNSDILSPESNKFGNDSLELNDADINNKRDSEAVSLKPVKSSQVEMEKVFKNMLDIGWSSNNGADVTIAELYLMYGSNGELRFEYDWISQKKEAELVQERLLMSLNNMLRRLSHLATMEVTEFSKVCIFSRIVYTINLHSSFSTFKYLLKLHHL